MDLTPEQIAANEAKTLADTAELKKQSKAEALRDLSKDLGINAFEPKELKAKFDEFTQWQSSQKSEQQKLQEQVDSYKTKETEWQTSKLEYESKMKASELGIPLTALEDALKLAGGDIEKLAEVVKKYPGFVSKDGIKFGVTSSDDFHEGEGLSEKEKYMAANPRIYKN